MEKKFEFIDIINELEQVELAPIILPCLKIVDPIAKVIPEGAIKNYLTRIRPKEGRFRFIEKLAPHLPKMVRWSGKVAAIKPLMVVFAIFAEALALILTIIIPPITVSIRFIYRIVGFVKKNVISVKH